MSGLVSLDEMKLVQVTLPHGDGPRELAMIIMVENFNGSNTWRLFMGPSVAASNKRASCI